MCVVRQDLEGDWINIVAVLIFCEGQLDELGALQRRSVDRVCPMFLDPRENVREVEERSIVCADRMRERLKGE